MAHELKKRKKYFQQKSSIHIRRCTRLPIHSSSQTQGKTTQSVNFDTVLHIPLKTPENTHFFMGKIIVTVSKTYFSIVVPQVDGEVFPTFGAKRQRI